MESVNKGNFSKIMHYISFVFFLYYVFFWDTRFIRSSIVLFGLLALSMLIIVIHQRIPFSASIKGMFFVVLCTIAGGFGAGESYALRICLQMIICFVVMIAFSFGELPHKSIIRIFIILCSFYCVGIFLHTISPELVDSVNKFLLDSAAYSSYQELASYHYYTGFSGFNVMPTLFASLLVSIYLSKLFFTKSSGLKKAAYIVVSFLGLSATVVAQKRGVFIACGVTIIIMVLLSFANKKNVMKFIAVILMLLAFVAVIYYFLQTTEAGQQFIRRFTESDDISSGRFDVYSLLLSEAKDTFLFGKGTGASQAMINMGAHNIYLQIVFDHGIAGLLIYMMWFIINLKYTMKAFKNHSNSPNIRQMLFISLYVQVLFLIYGFFGNPINDIYIFLLYVFFVAISFAIQTNIFQNKPQREIKVNEG